MLSVKKIEEEKNTNIVYDISLDGTFVNALGGNVLHNTDGFNFKMPDKLRYTEDNKYVAKGLNPSTPEGKTYVGCYADVAEFNELYFTKAFHENGINMMKMEIDEVVDATINFSRKNYADFFPDNPFPKDVKLVGNTIKSKKMPEYIAKFLSVGVRYLLRGEGQAFLEEYYSLIGKIYDYKIPLRDIATKGKIKKSVDQYLKDVKEITKAGRPKSRQAWYELAIKENISVYNGDTIYYINTGTSKSHTDVKKVTHYYEYDKNSEKVEVTKDIEKEYRLYRKDGYKTEKLTKDGWLKKYRPNAFSEDEILLNCMIVPRWVIDSDTDKYCSDMNNDGFEYNCPKYIAMFNSRIKPLLVCFSKEIRDDILITDPKDRKYFTEEQCKLVSGEPYKVTDQDTYEQLMTMEDKEIRFWTKYNMVPPFLEECGMGKWEDIVKDYKERMERERELGIDKEKEELAAAIQDLSKADIDKFLEDYEIPSQILKLCVLDPITFKLMSKNYPDIPIGSVTDIIERGDLISDSIDGDD